MNTRSRSEGRARRPRRAGSDTARRDASPYPQATASRRSGFSLIELIGVLAIMAILAAVLVPNALHSIEMAAIRAEGTNLQNLGDSVKLYLKTNRVLPGSGAAPATASWSNDLAGFADLAPADVLTSSRQQTRVFVTEPTVVPPTRALLISSMRAGLVVPTAGQINTLPLFNTAWNTADGSAPAGAPWTTNGWNATNAEYLTMKRINLRAINATDLQSMSITLSKVYAAGTISYRLISGVTGLTISQNTLPTPAPALLTTVTILNVRPRDRLQLYTDAAYTTLTYTYIFSADTTNTLTFNFVDSTPSGAPYWRPQ